MSDIQPQIHGIISREDMASRWRPYGDRLILDGHLDPDNITSGDAAQVLLGANLDDIGRACESWYNSDDDGYRRAGLRDMDGVEFPEDFKQIIVQSHAVQQNAVEKMRLNTIERSQKLTAMIQKGFRGSVDSGVLTKDQSEVMCERLYGPDGNPVLQYTIMSRLEYSRVVLECDKEEPQDGSSATTDFATGSIWAPVVQRRSFRENEIYSRPHEFVHGVAGLEIYDITRTDGWRYPSATVVGVFATSPTIEVGAGDDYTIVKNGEICEGYTDLVTRAVMRVVPRLGKQGQFKGYSGWGDGVERLMRDYPSVYRALGDVTTLVEATPSDPNAKQLALQELHDYADRVLGNKNSLTGIVTNGTLRATDVHTKNAQ